LLFLHETSIRQNSFDQQEKHRTPRILAEGHRSNPSTNSNCESQLIQGHIRTTAEFRQASSGCKDKRKPYNVIRRKSKSKKLSLWESQRLAQAILIVTVKDVTPPVIFFTLALAQ
jgi:hypothetical protein